MLIHNGDHAEFEREHADTPPKERPDWPLPSFDARDWAEAFVKTVKEHPEIASDEGAMIGWFANALMRGYDETAMTAKTWGDKPDQFSDRVKAAHPLRAKDDADRHNRYALAMEMIHSRHSKYALVDLVNWLLTKWPELQSEATR